MRQLEVFNKQFCHEPPVMGAATMQMNHMPLIFSRHST